MLKAILHEKITQDFIKISIGNVLEWYDFTLYGFFALQISHIFFPQLSSYAGLLLVFMTFAVGFLARPIGAAIFGIIGDRWGREYAVNLSIWLMVIPSVLIGCLPGYAQIGYLAPLLLMGLRIFQGISAGGQFSGLIVIASNSKPTQRTFLISLVYSISVIGSFLASIIGLLTLKLTSSYVIFSAWHQQSWRLAFLFSIVIFLVYLRLNHTATYLSHKTKSKLSLSRVLKSQPLEFAALSLFALANGTIYYILFTYLVAHIESSLQISGTIAFATENLLLLISIILYPWFGYRAAGSISRIKAAKFHLLCFLTTLSIIYLGKDYIWINGIGVILLVVSSCAITTYVISVFAETFDNRYRMTAFSLAYNIGATLSGLAPFIAELFSRVSKHAILYELGLAALGIYVALVILPKAYQA
jgi:MFS family permease